MSPRSPEELRSYVERLREALGSAPAQRSPDDVLSVVKEAIAALLAVAPSTIDPRGDLSDYVAGAVELRALRDALEQKIGRPVPVSWVAARGTIQDLADRLSEGESRARNPAAPARCSLAALASTFQIGREAMAARVAFVAASLEELRALCDAYLAGERRPAILVEPAAPARSEVPQQELLARMGRGDRDACMKLGRLWVSGESIRWETAYPQRPRRWSGLPTYPFAPTRYGFERLALTPSGHVVAPAPAPIPEPSPLAQERAARSPALVALHEPEQRSPDLRSVEERAAPLIASAEPARPASAHPEVIASVAELVCEVLCLEGVVARDVPLVELGLDSILAVELVKRLCRSLKVELRTTVVYDHPTVNELGGHIARLLDATAAQTRVAGRGDRDGDLLRLFEEVARGERDVDEAVRRLGGLS